MILSEIRAVAEKYTRAEIDAAATAWEQKRENAWGVKGKDEAEVLSNLLMAAVVRGFMEEEGLSLQDAVRKHSKNVQAIVRKKEISPEERAEQKAKRFF